MAKTINVKDETHNKLKELSLATGHKMATIVKILVDKEYKKK